jgi:hypothetical protein
VRADRSPGGFSKIFNGLDVTRMGRVGMHVEDENLAALQAGEPELAPVIGETAMVRLVLAGHRGGCESLCRNRASRA